MLYNTPLKGILLETITEKEHQFSPYTYLSEMHDEQREDEALQAIIEMCHEYLGTDDVTFKSNHSIDYVVMCYDFVQQKQYDLKRIKNTLSLDSGSTPLTSIGHAMDLITVSAHVKGYNTRSVYYELATHIDLTLEILVMCDSVLKRILNVKKKD